VRASDYASADISARGRWGGSSPALRSLGRSP